MATTSNLGLTLMDAGSLITAATMNTNLNKIDAAVGSGGGSGVKLCSLTTYDGVSGPSTTRGWQYLDVKWFWPPNIPDSCRNTITLADSSKRIIPPAGATAVLFIIDYFAGIISPTSASNSSGNYPAVELKIYSTGRAHDVVVDGYCGNPRLYIDTENSGPGFGYTMHRIVTISNNDSFRVKIGAYHGSSTSYKDISYISPHYMTMLFF